MTTEQQALQELEALEAIYGQDFSRTTTKTVWASANAAHEFVIRVRPVDESLHDHVGIDVHFKWPQAYPRVPPTISLEKPLGLTRDAVAECLVRLEKMSRSKELLGTEMCFEICSAAATFITDRHAVVQGQTSLRQEAELREAADRQQLQERQQKALEDERRERDKEHARLAEMLHEDKQRRVRVIEPQMSAKASSGAPAPDSNLGIDLPLTRLTTPFSLDGQDYGTVVRSSLAEQGPFIAVYHGEAYGDNMSIHIAVAIYRIELPRTYLVSSSTRRKMQVILNDLQRVSSVVHPHLQRIYAFQLTETEKEVCLEIFSDPYSQMSLDVLLAVSGTLSEDRAMNIMRQLAAALAELHAANITHDSHATDLLRFTGKRASVAKFTGASWRQHLIDLNRTEPFGPATHMERASEGWRPPETAAQVLTYTRARDMWELGRIFLHMVLGGDVEERFDTCYAAMQSEDFMDLSDHVVDILEALLEPLPKKRATASTLLGMLSKNSVRPGPVSPSLHALRQNSLPAPGVSILSPSGKVNSASSEGRASYFWQPKQQAIIQQSRYRTDFEEVEFLGKGGFGQVVKARNRLDGNFYAVKRIRLPTSQDAEQKLLREVTIWSRMAHPHIVRYNTSWVEEESDAGIEIQEAAQSLNASAIMSSQTSASSHPENSLVHDDADDFDLGLDDLDDLDLDFLSVSRSTSYIRFANDGDPSTAPSPDPDADEEAIPRQLSPSPVSRRRTLFIQMEYVGGGPNGQTLREAIDAGLSQDSSWRLLRQILSAMQHFTSINILHRDLKPSNIFLDAHGDVRVGDFGLAVEQAAPAAESATAKLLNPLDDADLTSDVGTGLYVAPEMASRGAGSRLNGQQQNLYTNKIDMYSLGVVAFEMWHRMSTAMERVACLRDLRSKDIKLPSGWKGSDEQTEILRWLLTHDPSQRASPMDLLQSNLLPSTGRDEAVESVVQLLNAPRSPHRPPLISALINQSSDERIIRDFSYDPPLNELESAAELEPFINAASVKLREIFEKRGAYHMPCDSITPLSDVFEQAGRKPFKLLDVDGNVLMLPYDLTVPLARKVAREPNLGRLKRWTIAPCYRPRPIGGSPEAIMAASFDIVSSYDTLAAEAEVMQMLDEVISSFPLQNDYVFVLNHASLFEFALEQIPPNSRSNVARILETFSKRSLVPWSKMANELYKQKDLTRRMVESLAPFHIFEDVKIAIKRLEALDYVSPLLHDALTAIRTVTNYCDKLGISRPIKLWPLFLANRTHFSRGGIGFQVSQAQKLGDVLAVGGRYDRLLAKFAPLGGTNPLPHMIGTAIAISKLAQAAAQDTRVAAQRAPPEYGPFAPRRCDVYVMSYASGLLEARMQVVAQLWQNSISADLMYDERDWSGQSAEQATATWRKEGILFIVIVKHAASGDQIVRVRNVLRGGEEDVPRLELPSYLSERLVESANSGRQIESANSRATVLGHRHHDGLRPNANNVQFVIGDEPGARKQRARNRLLVTEKAIESINTRLDNTDSPPVFVVDADGEAFRLMSESSAWLTRDDSFRALVAAAPAMRKNYLADVRAALLAHKASNPRCSWVFLWSMRESVSSLLSL